jgi:multiple sugar transport system substrate-binding protein
MKLTLGGPRTATRSDRRGRQAAAASHGAPAPSGWRRASRLGAVAVAAGLLAAAAGCSSSGSTSATSGTSANQKVNLTFWSWVPNLDKVVAIWNKSHPNIQVNVQVQAGGDAELAKLLTAAKGGNPPDVAQVEYQALPTLVSNNYLADISKYTSGLSSDFPAGIWNQVTLGTSAVYGVPQDAAPMAFFYRADLFKQYNLTVPTTWAQFLADAKKLHSQAPGKYLGTFSSADPGEFAGLAQQAGAKWWSASGSKWTVNINDAATQKVASFWQQAIATGGVNNQPQWTAAWNKGMNDGTYIGWVSDVWAPTDFPSVSASNAGKWVMTALPQWTAGANVAGNWGGSSTGVMAGSKHQQAAAQFATWLNTNPQATAALASVAGIYTADNASEAALSTPPSYFSDQPGFWSMAKQLAASSSQVTWGPDVNVAYSEFTTAFGTAATNKSSFLSPLTQVQSAVVNDMTKNGFTVAG